MSAKEVITLDAEVREKTGKGPARALRREGKIPAIIYGEGIAPVMVTVEQKAISLAYWKSGFMSQLFDLKTEGKTYRVLPKQIQLHPVTDYPEHADFLHVSDDTKVRVFVNVVFKNAEKAPGIRRGGTLNVVRRDIELLCSAASIPSLLEYDLTGLQIGDSVHISQFDLPEGVSPAIADRDFTVATIVGRKAEEEETEAGAEGEDADDDDENEDDKEGGDE